MMNVFAVPSLSPLPNEPYLRFSTSNDDLVSLLMRYLNVAHVFHFPHVLHIWVRMNDYIKHIQPIQSKWRLVSVEL